MNFWGLRVMSGKSYKQTVMKDYRVSHAVLDTNTVTKKEIVSLQVEVNGSSFILCNLCVDHGILQVPLEYIFSKGEVVVFSISSENEEAVVHLSGYTINTSCTNCKGKIDVNCVSPLTNVTNVKSKTLKNVNRICKNEPSIKEEKENEIPSEDKETDSKSSDKKTSQKNKKKSKSKKKITSLEEMLNSIGEEEEEDDDYTPELDEDTEEEEEENENEEVGEEEEEEEEELNLEEEEEDSDDSDDELLSMEEIEEDLKESKDDDDDIVNIVPKKKKRRLSPSSAGRTPIAKASKKSKIQVISGSTINETSTNKKKKKSPSSNCTFDKSPEENENKNDTSSSSEKSDASDSLASKGIKRFGMGGVIIEDLVIGTGAKASKGKKVSVYYEGKLKNGKVFDQRKSGSCFKFKIGANEVIKAWEVGIVGMKVGGKRRIVAPPSMAYGREGCPPEIPPKAILTFEVELKGVN